MPVFALAQQPHVARPDDVIGVYSSSSSRFIRHVALYGAEDRLISWDQEVEVVHMGPPLEISGKARAHVVATVPLTNDEAKEIGAWIAEIADEYRLADLRGFRQYHVHPPCQDFPPVGVRRYRRYSCAGFVLDAYSQVGIPLLLCNEQDLPEVGEQELCSAYPGIPLDLLDRFGVQGPSPWRIVLAGYIVHALNRPSEHIRSEPYSPQPGDAYY